MMKKSTFNKLLTPLTIILLLLTILLSRMLYGYMSADPSPFSDIWNNISNLGDYSNNPIGFLYFQFWGVIAGLYILHTIPYIHSNLMQFKDQPVKIFNKPILEEKLTADLQVKMGTFFLILAGFGFVMMGSYPANLLEDLYPNYESIGGAGEWIIENVHEIFAAFGFGGIFFSSVNHYAVCEAAGEKVNQKVRIFITVLWIVLFIGGGLALLTQNYFSDL